MTKHKTLSDPGFHSLLVPVDLTPSSDRILGRLARLPLAEGARLTLLHVVPSSLSFSDQRHAQRDAERVLAEEVRHLRQQLDRQVSIETLVKVGAAAKEIAACGAKVKAELIVMGRGGGRMSDAFLGSTAERVLRQARIPVLVVRLPARSGYRRPALALDLDQDDHQLLQLMLRLLPPPRPLVEVIHAFDIPYLGQIYPSLSELEVQERKDEERTKVTRALEQRLESALAKAGVAPEYGPLWKPHVRHGSPRMVVAKAMKKAETDLLVLGTHGHSGAAYVFLGTVAGDLLRAARCDVLVVPPERES